MDYQRLLVSRDGPVVRVVLNRPESRNALDETGLDELTRVFLKISKEPGVRLAVLSGAGKDFCAGADIGWMRRAAAYGKARNLSDAKRLVGLCRALDEAPFPVIARVHGSCYGAGLGLAAASDIVLADPESRFCFSEVRLGILPAVVSTFVLPKIGMFQARRYFLTAEVFRAAEAKELGLVHEVVAAQAMDAREAELSARVLGNGPAAVREAKALIRLTQDMPRARRLEYSVKTLARLRASAEGQEGLSAFLEKRDPAWVPESMRRTA